MAKTNKYASINFNNVYEKNLITGSNANGTKHGDGIHSTGYLHKNPSSSTTTARSNGRMLVLTRTTAKPVTSTSPPLVSPPKPAQDPPRVNFDSDPISLRPLGKTGGGGSLANPPIVVGSTSPKPEKFVPPHLRPGFVARQENSKEPGQSPRQYPNQNLGSSPLGNDGRPISGGGARRVGGGDPDSGLLNRPRSGGSRPSSSG
ncbi:hypothetical protein LINGRAHAP2_LOCUS18696 [Linum grandiflorum]